MLRIGTVRWRGKCSRHPMFDPQMGEGAVKGGCVKCTSLVEIYQLHQKMMGLMRSFSPPQPPRRRANQQTSTQASLFGDD